MRVFPSENATMFPRIENAFLPCHSVRQKFHPLRQSQEGWREKRHGLVAAASQSSQNECPPRVNVFALVRQTCPYQVVWSVKVLLAR